MQNKYKKEKTDNNCWNKSNQRLDKKNFRNTHKNKTTEHTPAWTSSKGGVRPDDSEHVTKYYRTEHPAILSLLVAMTSQYKGVFKPVSIIRNIKLLVTIIVNLLLF